MLLREWRITEILPCIVNPEWIRIKTELSDDVSEVLPYLNAIIKEAVYNPKGKSLTFRFRGGQMLVTIFPRAINLAQVPNLDEGKEALDELKNLINESWERRRELTPVYEKRALKAKDILDLLPKTNCRECGLPTCFAFAVAITRGERKPGDCPPLRTSRYRENAEALKGLLKTAGLEEEA